MAVDSDWAPYIFIHEFGHHFAGLADEYYTSPVAYEAPEKVDRALGAERHRPSSAVPTDAASSGPTW